MFLFAMLGADLPHRLNQNSEYFQLLHNNLHVHIFVKSLYQEPGASVFLQALGVESYILAWVDRPQHPYTGPEAVSSVRYKDDLSPCILG